MSRRRAPAVLLVALLAGCAGQGEGEPRLIHVPAGASFGQVTDSLATHDIVTAPPLFQLYARLTGSANEVQAGTYAFRPGTGWRTVLDALVNGRVVTARLVMPEGYDLRRVAPRIAELTGLSEDSVLAVVYDTATARRFDVPGPTLEGYVYPATYTVPLAVSLDRLLARMTQEYRRRWTPARQAAADSIGMSEREVVTLASIVEKEAKKPEEMRTIAAVYRNRLRIGRPLEADPTVQYALGEHQKRLLYAHIDSVADDPYNTYRRRGLPPGPIGSPTERAIDAVLRPDTAKYLYFVARPDGSHVFSRSLEEHNLARARLAPAWRAYRARAAADSARRAAADSAAAADTTAGGASGLD